MKAIGHNMVLRLSCIFGIFASCTDAYILRLPCKAAANFSMVRRNAVLQGSVIGTFLFTTLQECQLRCVQNNFCKSINHQVTDKNMCELNNVTPEETETDEDKMMKKDGWNFLSTDYNDPTIGPNCKKLNPCGKEVLCTDTCECDGYKCNTCNGSRAGLHCEQTWPDCDSVRKAGMTKNGVYLIRTPDDVNSTAPTTFKVYCDLNSNGRGWMVLQRRVDNTTSFNRSWEEYQTGFGNLRGNLWLGLEKIHRLAAPKRRPRLRVDLIAHDDINLKLFAEYGTFSVDSEQTNYLLAVKNFDRRSTLNDSFNDEQLWFGRLVHNNKMFSTRWHENDSQELLNCAESFSGGWWFSECYLNHLNGVYQNPSVKIDCTDKYKAGVYMTWNNLRGNCFGGIYWVEMKIRYTNDWE